LESGTWLFPWIVPKLEDVYDLTLNALEPWVTIYYNEELIWYFSREGYNIDISMGKYLGLPSMIGRNKKGLLKFIKEKKINSSSYSKLFHEKLFDPFLIGDAIDEIMNSFWWSNIEGYNKWIRWLSWDKLPIQKKDGTMRLKNLHTFNLKLLGKQVWGLLSKPDSLVAPIYKAT